MSLWLKQPSDHLIGVMIALAVHSLRDEYWHILVEYNVDMLSYLSPSRGVNSVLIDTCISR